MANRQCFVVLSHYLTPRISMMLDRLRRELASDHDVVLLCYFPDDAVVPEAIVADSSAFIVRHSDTRALGYPTKGQQNGFRPMKFGDIDLPLMVFAQKNLGYNKIWLFEGDVEFTGSLRALVDHFDAVNVDLLTTNYRKMPRSWAHQWKSCAPTGARLPTNLDNIALLAAFRVSRKALDTIDTFYRNGGNGHNEWTWSYALEEEGLSVADMRDHPLHGRPVYSSSRWSDSLYPGSFRTLPTMTYPGRRANTLWHPVKDGGLSPSLNSGSKVLGITRVVKELARDTWFRLTRR